MMLGTKEGYFHIVNCKLLTYWDHLRTQLHPHLRPECVVIMYQHPAGPVLLSMMLPPNIYPGSPVPRVFLASRWSSLTSDTTLSPWHEVHSEGSKRQSDSWRGVPRLHEACLHPEP